MGKCTECMYKFCTQCREKWHPFKRCPKALLLMKDNEGKIQNAQKFVDERLNMLYIDNCSKACPNCQFAIQKTEGCNKMTCQQCNTKFCWECKAILPWPNPYDHFNDNPACWTFGNEVQEELKQEVLDQHVDPEQAALAIMNVSNTANCPKCSSFIVRPPSKINLLKCDTCQIYFCFNCGRGLGKLIDGEEAAKKHFEIAFCFYRPLS